MRIDSFCRKVIRRVIIFTIWMVFFLLFTVQSDDWIELYFIAANQRTNSGNSQHEIESIVHRISVSAVKSIRID